MQSHAHHRQADRRGGGARHARRARGDDTRQRILAAALDVFAAEGYEGTTTRRLADVAAVNLPAIQYYFGSKEGLYRAAIAHHVATMESRVAPAADKVSLALAAGNLSRRQALTLLCLMLDTFAALVADQTFPDWKSRAMFFARAEIEPSAKLDPLHEWAERRIFRPCASLIGHLIGRPADEEATLLHTLTVFGQILMFCNHKAQHILGWPEIDGTRVRAIQTLVREHTQAIFRPARRPRP
ncbi:MAG TPA: CerR family C-terminal domain-containing protein [Candidatus Sulfotelmatobacter sp.]|nr:CerR family C-terminal domain-containing protein [Candidatus Sulfotelmatobacter sp.]